MDGQARYKLHQLFMLLLIEAFFFFLVALLFHFPSRPDIFMKRYVMGKSHRLQECPMTREEINISQDTISQTSLPSDCPLLWGVVSIYPAFGIAFDSH